MTTAIQLETISTEQLLLMPDDGKDRWLIRGELREAEMTRRNRGHSRIEAKFAYLLCKWNDSLPEPHGEVLVGEAGIRLRRDPDTTVGVDVAYLSAETSELNTSDEGFVEGVPLLVVEVLSPSDKHEAISEKVESYLQCGVKLVIVIDPVFRTLTVFRPDAEPQLFNITQLFSADPHLPGFRIAVRDVFTR